MQYIGRINRNITKHFSKIKLNTATLHVKQRYLRYETYHIHVVISALAILSLSIREKYLIVRH